MVFPFAVMELLDGETLRQRIKNSPLAWRKAVEIAVPIAEGLSLLIPKALFIATLSRKTFSHFRWSGQNPGLRSGSMETNHTEQELSVAPTQSQVTQGGSVEGYDPLHVSRTGARNHR